MDVYFESPSKLFLFNFFFNKFKLISSLARVREGNPLSPRGHQHGRLVVRVQRAHGLRSDHLFLLRHERSSLTESPSRAVTVVPMATIKVKPRGSTVATAVVQLVQQIVAPRFRPATLRTRLLQGT